MSYIGTPASSAKIDASGLAPTFTLRKAFAAGGGGGADDVTIYNAAVPFDMRIVGVEFLIATTVLLSTIQLRDATGGAGSVKSASVAASAAGRVVSLGDTSTTTLSSGDSLVIRRSDSGIAGEVVITLIKI